MTPRKRRRRHALRGAVCAVLAIALQMLPLEVRPTPDAEPVLGTPSAAAQPTPTIEVQYGTPNPCPLIGGIDWSPVSGDPDWPTAEECTLVLPACPENAAQLRNLGAENLMRLSVLPPGLDVTQFPMSIQIRGIDYQVPSPSLPLYPDFCEFRILDSQDPAIYAECISMKGHVMRMFVDGIDPGCRLLRPLACPDGLQHVTPKTCKGIQRRTWNCPTGYEPHNRFNTCIRETAGGSGSNPACATNWPQLPLSSCEAYVGGDYFSNPSDQALNCATGSAYDTGTPVFDVNARPAILTASSWSLSDAAPAGMPRAVSAHWCAYDSRALQSECHGAAATRQSECPAASAAERFLCIKRASGVGGCAAIAETIKCRAFEQAFSETPATVPIDYVRRQGCSPCMVLPFRPVPQQCPPDMQGPAEIGFYEKRIDRNRREIYLRSQEHPVAVAAHLNRMSSQGAECADPPPGWLQVSPTHSSGVAVVNTAVVVTVDGLDLEQQRPNDLTRIDVVSDTRTGSNSWQPNLLEFIGTGQRKVPRQIRYTVGDETSGRRVKTWRAPDASLTYNELQDIAGVTECVVERGPTFRLHVQVLWPDYGGAAFRVNDPNCSGAIPTGDAAEIRDLFGGLESLSWWCALDESGRKQLTMARGITWWPDFVSTFSGTRQQAVLARSTALTQTLPCAFGIPMTIPGHQQDPQGTGIWCHWVPGQPGYHRLQAGSAWDMRKSTAVADRTVTAPHYMDEVLNFFNDPQVGQVRRENADVRLRFWRSQPGLADRDWPEMGIDFMGAGNDIGVLTPAPGWLESAVYEENSAPVVGCPSIDLRILCSSTYEVIDYTETDPIGVIVYESRVVTRAPS